MVTGLIAVLTNTCSIVLSLAPSRSWRTYCSALTVPGYSAFSIQLSRFSFLSLYKLGTEYVFCLISVLKRIKKSGTYRSKYLSKNIKLIIRIFFDSDFSVSFISFAKLGSKNGNHFSFGMFNTAFAFTTSFGILPYRQAFYVTFRKENFVI